jgi:hypothetical protein
MSRRFPLSTSESTDFDEWLADMVGRYGKFTVLVILTSIGDRKIVPLCSTFFHVIGDDVDWEEIRVLFASSGQHWDGAAFFPTNAQRGGPIDNPTARQRLAELEAKVTEDRMILNEGHYFDTLGRRIKIEPLPDA